MRLAEIVKYWSKPETRNWFPAYDAVQELLQALKAERAYVAKLRVEVAESWSEVCERANRVWIQRILHHDPND